MGFGEQLAFESALQNENQGFEFNDLIEAPIATLADIAVTTANGLTFDQFEWSTEGFLRSLGADQSADFYLDHQDAVQVASFVGGLALPLGAALKGMQLAKAGKFLAPRFNKLRQWEDQLALSRDNTMRLLAEGNAATSAINAERWNRWMTAGKTELVQAAIAETAVLTALSAHPYMEDYDAWTFATSTLLGGLSVPLRIIQEGHKIKTGAIELFTKETDPLSKVAPFMFTPETPTGNKIMHRMANLEAQEQLLSTDLSTIARQQLERWRLQEIGNQLDDVESLLEGPLKEKAKALRNQLNRSQGIADTLKGGDEWNSDALNDVYRFLYDSKAGLKGVQSIRELPHKMVPRMADDVVVLDPFFNAMVDGKSAKKLLRHTDVAKKLSRYNAESRWSAKKHTDLGAVKTQDADREFVEALYNYDRGLVPVYLRTGDKIVEPKEINDLARLQAAAMTSPDVQVKWAGQQAKAVDALIPAKLEAIKHLVEGPTKRSIEEIAILTNTPKNLIEEAVSAKYDISRISKSSPTEWSVYNQVGDSAKQYMRRRKLHLRGEALNQDEVLNPVKQLDRQTLENLGDTWVSNQIQALKESNADVGKFMKEIAQSATMKNIRENITALASPLQGRAGAFTSADFSLRRFGSLADNITSIGTTVAKFQEKAANEQIAKMSPIVGQVKRNPGAVAQFAQIQQAWHQLPATAETAFYDAAERRIVLAESGPGLDRRYLTHTDGTPITITAGPLDDFMKALFVDEDSPMDYLRQVRNGNRALEGKKLLNRTIYFPYASHNEKFVGYLINKADPSKTSKFIARSEKELSDMAAEYRKQHAGGSTEVVLHGESPLWNHAHQYSRSNPVLTAANPSLHKSGTGFMVNGADPKILDEFLTAYSQDVIGGYRGLLEKAQPNLFNRLDDIANQHNAAIASTTSRKPLHNELNPAKVARNSLLNTSGTDDVPFFARSNDNFRFALNLGLSKTQELFGKTGTVPSREKYTEFLNEMKKSGVIKGELPSYMAWARANTDYFGNAADDFVGTASSLMVALNLKIGEVSHALATVASLPILTLAETANSGAPLRSLYRGMAAFTKGSLRSDSPEAAILAKAVEKGYANAEVAEATANMARLHAAPSGVNKLLESNIVHALSAPTVKTEEWVRSIAYMTGYDIAQKKHGKVSQEILEHAANAFTKKVMGNYTSGQRPVVYQGTLGHVLGLYQTYMLTFAQNGFRYLEQGDRKALGTMLASQVGAYGLSSLPMYDFYSNLLAQHVFDDNMNLENMAIKLGGKNFAEFTMYGLPSWMSGMALSTRGDISFRTPVSFDMQHGVSFAPPLLSAAKQSWDLLAEATDRVRGIAASQGGPLDYAKGFTQALSLQSLSRPIARMAELAQGYSLDSSGRVINMLDAEDYLTISTYGRVFGSRPLKEHVVRQTRYMNDFYEAQDRARRDTLATNPLKIYATGSSDMSLGAIFDNYMSTGGTASGFKSAVNTAYMEKEGLEAALGRTADYPAIQEILRTYYPQ